MPAGKFLMGSDPTKDKEACDNEKPQHRLTLPEFYIGKYPVTMSQFAVFAQAQNYQTDAEREGYGWLLDGQRMAQGVWRIVETSTRAEERHREEGRSSGDTGDVVGCASVLRVGEASTSERGGMGEGGPRG